MTLDQIQTFEEVIKTGSFRGASTSLKKAQSAVSYAVQNLEKELGFQLFSRKDYRPVLTSQGKLFYDRAQSFLEESRNLSNFGKNISSLPSQGLFFYVHTSLPLNLSTLLKNLYQEFKDLKIEITYNSPNKIINFENPFVFTEIPTLWKGFESVKIFDSPSVYVAAPSALKSFPSKLTKGDLFEIPEIFVFDDSQSPRPKYPLSRSNRWSVGTYQDQLEYLLQGFGFGKCPHFFVKPFLKKNKLKILRIQDQDEEIATLYLAWKRFAPHGRVADFLRKEALKLGK